MKTMLWRTARFSVRDVREWICGQTVGYAAIRDILRNFRQHFHLLRRSTLASDAVTPAISGRTNGGQPTGDRRTLTSLVIEVWQIRAILG